MTLSCTQCKFCGALLNQDQVLVKVCRFNPPRVFTALVQRDNKAQWLTTTAYPGVSDTDWCGKFEPAVTN